MHPTSPEVRPFLSLLVSLRTYLFILLSLCMAVPVIFLGSLEAREWDQTLAQNLDESMMQTADRLSAEVTVMMTARINTLRATATTVGALEDWNQAALDHVTQGAHDDEQAYGGVFIADTSGVSLSFSKDAEKTGKSGVDYSDRDYFKAVRETQNVVMSDVMQGRVTDEPLVAVAAPIMGLDSAWRGAVVGGIGLGLLEQIVASIRNSVHDHHVILLDGKGQVLVDSRGVHSVLTPVLRKPFFQDPPTTPSDRLDENRHLQRVFRREIVLQNQVWSIWILTPESLIQSKTDEARARVRFFVLLSILIAFIIALAASSVLDRNVRRLKQFAVQIGEGDLSLRLQNPSPWVPAEIRSLVDAIQQTLDRVETADLEKRTLVSQLEESHAQMQPLAAAWNQIGDAIEFTDSTGRIIYTNPAARHMIHQQASAPIRSDVFDDPDVLNDGLWDLLNKGHSWRGIVERESPASQPTTQAITISPLRYQSHTLDRIVVIRRDITELRAAERASENNARLAALGTMAATVGHEINNPLTYVRANIENVIEQLGEIPEAASEDILTSMDDALEGTQRVAEIVKRMLSLARTPIHETENIAKVTPVVTNALAVTRNAIRHRATLQVSIEDDLVVAMRESSLFQVLVNLLQNAGQAIPEGQASGNTVSIRGQRTTDSAGVDWIRIDVSDTGAGISRDISDKIFDPFFTTKDVGKGTGLGLSVCKTLIDQAQGRISILDRQEQGSTFRMELRPAAANLPISLPEAAVPESIASKRILVLDDDPRVGRAVKTVLSNHEVITYDKAEEAIHAVRNGVFDLVICDVMMPDINGIQVRDLMLRDRPDLTNRWIFMSGGIFGTALSQDIRESSVPLIDKPIEKEVLLHALRRMFGNETSPQS